MGWREGRVDVETVGEVEDDAIAGKRNEGVLKLSFVEVLEDETLELRERSTYGSANKLQCSQVDGEFNETLPLSPGSGTCPQLDDESALPGNVRRACV